MPSGMGGVGEVHAVHLHELLEALARSREMRGDKPLVARGCLRSIILRRPNHEGTRSERISTDCRGSRGEPLLALRGK